MAYGTDLERMIQEDLQNMKGRLETVKAGALEKMIPKKVKLSLLHVNPDDEFTFPNIGPNTAIVENYCTLARRQYSMGEKVFDEPVQVNKLRQGGYLILNGHHRWAGVIRAGVPVIRIQITDP